MLPCVESLIQNDWEWHHLKLGAAYRIRLIPQYYALFPPPIVIIDTEVSIECVNKTDYEHYVHSSLMY